LIFALKVYNGYNGSVKGVKFLGITYIEGKVKGPVGKEEQVRFLVDSGATYSLLPESVWRTIGLTPKREYEFTLADGTIIKRKVSECYISLPQGEGHAPVILGEAGDEALLGVVTLEVLGLVLDPFKRTLRPMHMLLV
jgi:clan AA aspartic protease